MAIQIFCYWLGTEGRELLPCMLKCITKWESRNKTLLDMSLGHITWVCTIAYCYHMLCERNYFTMGIEGGGSVGTTFSFRYWFLLRLCFAWSYIRVAYPKLIHVPIPPIGVLLWRYDNPWGYFLLLLIFATFASLCCCCFLSVIFKAIKFLY